MHDPRTELAAQTLRQRGRLRLRVTGTSMLPSVLPGDVVFVRRCDGGAMQCGELVLFQRAQRLYVHRVVGRDGAALVTQGDANPQCDGPVQPSEFLGRVVRQLRGGTAFRPLQQPQGVARAAAALFRRSSRASR
ncbi:S26 family signal peptidase, partial [Ramlibacter sp.]|uniref:S26 family signal peptidase n=1 Tax=Ramlibacter sp. TaxID=1917967 RepID=UPI00180734F0